MSVTRMTRMVGFSIPPAMAEELERMADEEQRTKSELFREMFRVYRNYRRQKQQQDEAGIDWQFTPVIEEPRAGTDAEAERTARTHDRRNEGRGEPGCQDDSA